MESYKILQDLTGSQTKSIIIIIFGQDSMGS